MSIVDKIAYSWYAVTLISVLSGWILVRDPDNVPRPILVVLGAFIVLTPVMLIIQVMYHIWS